jgi:hypothetical protein
VLGWLGPGGWEIYGLTSEAQIRIPSRARESSARARVNVTSNLAVQSHVLSIYLELMTGLQPNVLHEKRCQCLGYAAVVCSLQP